MVARTSKYGTEIPYSYVKAYVNVCFSKVRVRVRVRVRVGVIVGGEKCV